MSDDASPNTAPDPAAGHEPTGAALARALADLIMHDFPPLRPSGLVIGMAGESGSGKSTAATGLARDLTAAGVRTGVLHQDDYFRRPPRTNHEHRLCDLGAVGPHEVDLDLLGAHIAAFRARSADVTVPTVDYPGNRFLTRRVDMSALDALIVEGTYVLQLAALDVRIFFAATHLDTRERRRTRNRDIDAPVIDTILGIEHRIIAEQAAQADVVVDRDFAIVRRQR